LASLHLRGASLRGALQAVNISLNRLARAQAPASDSGLRVYSATATGRPITRCFTSTFSAFGRSYQKRRCDRIGSSHAEFGIDSSMLSKDRGFNMALGGGEGLSFAARLLEKYQPYPSLIALDPFSPDPDGPSTEAARVLASTQAVSHRKVFISGQALCATGCYRGWAAHHHQHEVAIMGTASRDNYHIRNWQSADVTAVYSNSGELFADASRGHPIVEGPSWTGYPPSADELRAIKERTDKSL